MEDEEEMQCRNRGEKKRKHSQGSEGGRKERSHNFCRDGLNLVKIYLVKIKICES